MADFLSRLIERTMAREPAVAPVISPMYAQERSELRQEMPLQVVASEDDHPLIADIPPIGADLVVSQSVTPTLINPQRLQFPQQAPAKTDLVLSQEESLSRLSVNLPAQSIQRS